MRIAILLLFFAASLRLEAVVSKKVPVLVELFTSEGCSSCPPADAIFASLGKVTNLDEAEVIPLAFHVDYWDRLGWKDPYSSKEWTERQNQYARTLGNAQIYTPQMIIDGKNEAVGSRQEDVSASIRKAARIGKTPLLLKWMPATNERILRIEIASLAALPVAEAKVFLAVTESSLTSEVLRGENDGKKLRHEAVVRSLGTLEGFFLNGTSVRETPIAVKEDWNAKNLSAVVFIQSQKDRQVLGIGRIAF